MKYPAYPAYSKPEAGWLGALPKTWRQMPLKRKFRLINGSTPTASEPEYWDGDIVWLTPADFSKARTGFLSTSDRRITREGLDSCGASLVPANSLALTTRAPIGGIAQGKVEFCTNQGCKSLAVDSNEVNERYVFYVLTVSSPQLNALGLGSTFMELSSDALGMYNFPVPSPNEQKQIAAFLDWKTGQIDALIAKKKQLIEKLQEQRIAVITQAVTKGLNPDAPMRDSDIPWMGSVPEAWDLTKLRFMFKFGRGLGITKADLLDSGIPCINYGEIHSKYGFEVIPETHDLNFVSEDYLESGTKSLLSYGDFVFADTSEDIEGSGNFSYLNSKSPTFAGYHTITAKPLEEYNPRYLAYLFDSIAFRHQIRKNISGVKVFSITQGLLKSCSAWLPKIDEQSEIIDYLDLACIKMDQIAHCYQTAIEKITEYRTALIAAATTGKIDVREFHISALKPN